MKWQHALRGKMWTVVVMIAAIQTTHATPRTTTYPPTTYSPSGPRIRTRLVNGTTASGYKTGRLVISTDGYSWTDICYYNDNTYAMGLMCQQHGFSKALRLNYEPFGGGAEVSNVKINCRRHHTSLDQCSTRYYTNAPVTCTPLSLVCFNKTKDVITMRLADNTTNEFMATGRLEIDLADQGWGAVCSSNNRFLSNLACQNMGFKHGSAVKTTAPDNGTMDIVLRAMECNYRASDLSDCTMNVYQWNSSYSYCYGDNWIGLRCSNTSVRLFSYHPAVYYVGTVELMKSSGRWSEICDAGWDDTDAKVTCRELGFEDGKALCCSQLGASSSNSSAYTNVACRGNEASLVNCTMTFRGVGSSCSSENDVSKLASVICYDKPINVIDMDFQTRLVHDGVDNTEMGWGTVQVRRFGFWGDVCSDYFTDKEASVACRSLSKGYIGGKAYGGYNTKYRYRRVNGKWRYASVVVPTRPVWIRNVTCNGTESSLEHCEVKDWGRPTKECYVGSGVICYRKELQLQLAREGSKMFGRLEIVHDGMRGTICGEGFDDRDARTACRQLNYTTGTVLMGDYPRGSGPVFMSNVRCFKQHESFFSCYSKWKNATSQCMSHSYDAKVICNNEVGLVSGTHSTGLVVSYDESLNPKLICDDGYFDDNAAKVVCRSLGFKKGLALPPKVFIAANYRPGTKFVGLQCAGNETTLADCPRNSTARCTGSRYGYSYASLSRHDYASVSCFDEEQTKERYWLDMTNEEGNQLAGRVRVFYKQTSGYVCQRSDLSSYLNDTAAYVVCRQLGRKGGVALSFQDYVQGPYFINDTRNCSSRDKTLDTCTTLGQGYYSSAAPAQAAGVLCYNSVPPTMTLVRDGPSKHQGRIAIHIDGEEGRVCGHRWYNYGAKGICKMLGYNEGMATRYPRGDDRKPFFMSGVRCFNSPNTIFMCRNYGWRRNLDSYCSPDNATEAGVFCFSNVRIQSYQQSVATNISGPVKMKYTSVSWKYVCADLGAANAKVICRELGFNRAAEMKSRKSYSWYITNIRLNCRGSETNTTECRYSTSRCSYRANLFCYNENPQEEWKWTIQNSFHGSVHVLHQGLSGYVCAGGWDSAAANTLCVEKGYKGGIAFGAVSKLSYSSGVVWFSNVTCPPGATNMTQCQLNKTVDTTCRHSNTYPAAVLCYKVSAPTVSIVDGPTSAGGRVQIDYDGVKGSVCRRSWSRNDARVLCKQLGYVDGEATRAPANSSRHGPVYLSGLLCSYSHTSIFQCPNQGWTMGRFSSSCLKGSDEAWVSCHTAVKIYGGLKTVGPLGYYNGYVFQLVCSEGFDDKAAMIACSELGFRYGMSLYPRAFGYQRRSVGQVVNCNGTNVQLFNDCMNRTSPFCRNARDYASVACSNQDDVTAYKVSMQWKDHGHVIVDHYNHEGYICSDGFDDKDALVVCRESFYLAGVAYTSISVSTNNVFWLSNLDCSGHELRLDQCRIGNKPVPGQFGKTRPSPRCTRAGVFCGMTQEQVMFDWRLRDNTTNDKPRAGLLQVKLNGTWGSVCSSWYRQHVVADIFCRQQGYTAGDIISNTFGRGLDAVWINRIQCSGNESRLQDCMMEIAANRTCYSNLAIRCDLSVRLSGFGAVPPGESLRAGKLEVAHSSGRFVSACATTFNNLTADLTCKELGHVAAFYQTFKATVWDALSSGSANITCPATATGFSNCTVNVTDDEVCPESLQVALFCLDVTNPREDLTLTMQHRPAGQPRVTRFGFEGSVCGLNFSDENADVVCRQLGYGKGYKLKPTKGRASQVLPYVLSGLSCSGREPNVGRCSRDAFVDSGIDCTGISVPNVLCTTTTDKIEFRRNPSDATWARAEVKIDGVWKAVYGSGFGTLEASVFCKSLGTGFTSGSATRRASLSLGRIPVAVSRVDCRGDENTILECSGNWTDAANQGLSSSRTVYVRCQRPVKLSYGSSRSGMVLYKKGYKWGAICADSFDHRDAVVVCRELGFDSGYSTCCSPYGSTWRDYHYTNVECRGNETRLSQCQFSTDSGSLDACSSRNYASVACYYNSDSRDFNLTFETGSTYSGAIHITYLGTAGFICNDTWDDNDARVACREMGFEHGLAYTHYRSLSSYYMTGPFWTSDFNCSGTENSLGQCKHLGMGNVTECKTRHFAGALCYVDTAIAYRLIPSAKNNNSVAGRVEAYVNGRWSPLCSSYWGNSDARVFCRSQGYVDGVEIDMPSGVPATTVPSLKGRLRCNGTESELNDCLHEGWSVATRYSCRNHYDDAAANCFKTVRLDSWNGEPLSHGPFRIYTGDKWSLMCDDDFDDVTAKYVCNNLGYADGRALCCSAYNGVYISATINHTVTLHCNGDEPSLEMCISNQPCDSDMYASVVCETPNVKFNDTVFNITNSKEGPYGRLQVQHLGITGIICSENWTDTDAHVFCKSKGYTSGLAYYHSHLYESKNEKDIGPFLLSNFGCTGNETSLTDCPHSGRLDLGNCTDSASVACYRTSGVQYRLRGGQKNYGRVEMALDNVWGTVCDDGWDNLDADVFCRSINFTSGIAQSRAKYGQGTGPLWLRDIHCDGTEAAIHACPHTGFTGVMGRGYRWYTRRCSTHMYDATVFCYMFVRVINDYQMLDIGAVQLYHNKEWLGGCDSGFTNTEAAVACKSLMGGFVDGVVIKGSAFGNQSVPLEISSVKCTGQEESIDQCTIQTGVCSSGYYASVQCSNTTIDQTGYQVRLANDRYSSDKFGIVEIYDNGVWKRICHQGWDQADATVVCKELKFKGGVVYTHINKHLGPIGFRQMNCSGSETSLQQCSNSTTPDLENCQYDDFGAGALCYTGSGVFYSLSGGNNSSMGRVDITYDGATAGICSTHWSHNNSRVLCRGLGHQDGLPYTPKRPAPRYPFFFLNGVFCLGHETTLLSCLNTGFNSSYMGYYCSKEAYTACYNQTVRLSDTRLMLKNGSRGYDRGRVEVFLSGPNEWGTVCDDFWDDYDATVVCRFLGFQWGEGLRRAAHGKGTGRILLDNVECLGNETSLQECGHRGFATHNCYHSEDASVVCHNTSRPTLSPTSTIPVTPTTPPSSTTTPSSTPSSTTPVTNGITPTGASQEANKTVPLAVGISVSLLLLLVVVIVVVLLVRRYQICRPKTIPHEQFSDETIGVGMDGTISMHNQMYDAADTGSEPISDSQKYLAGAGEITLDNSHADSNLGSSNGHSGNLDSGFTNPVYSVMQPPRQDVAGFSSEKLEAPDKKDDGAGAGSSA